MELVQAAQDVQICIRCRTDMFPANPTAPINPTIWTLVYISHVLLSLCLLAVLPTTEPNCQNQAIQSGCYAQVKVIATTVQRSIQEGSLAYRTQEETA